MRHGTPFIGDLGSRTFTDLAETVLELHCSLILLPAFSLSQVSALHPTAGFAPFSGSFPWSLTGVSSNKSLAGLNSSCSCFSENLSSHTQGLKQCLRNKWLAQVHTASKTTDPELEPRSLFPPSKAFYTQITNHLRNMSLVPLSRGPMLWWILGENVFTNGQAHSWPLSSVYNYVDSSGRKNICPRFREDWSDGLGQWRKSGLCLN